MLAGLLLGAASIGPAIAQQVIVEPDGSEPVTQPDKAKAKTASTYIAEPRERYTLLVLGDTLAGGLWAGLGRTAKPEDRLQIEGRYREGSGFTRPDLYDWLEALPGILDRNQVNAAAVLIGSTDGQDFRVDGKRLTFGSAEWKDAYRKVVDAFLAELRKRNIAVYWIGLPPMARPDYDEAMQVINGLVKERADALGVKFIDTRKAFADEAGNYTEMGTDIETGAITRLRDRDGVKFLKRGNSKLASLLLDVLREDIKAVETPAGPDTMPDATAANSGIDNGLPYFGQPGPNGPILIQPELPRTARGGTGVATDIAGIAEVIDLDAPGGVDGLEVLQQTAPPGSVAARLFAQGISPAPRPGRIDDFSWQPEPSE